MCLKYLYFIMLTYGFSPLLQICHTSLPSKTTLASLDSLISNPLDFLGREIVSQFTRLKLRLVSDLLQMKFLMILSMPLQMARGSHNVCIQDMRITLITDLAIVTLLALFNNRPFQVANFDWILSKMKLKSDFLAFPCINGKPRYLPKLLANFTKYWINA